MKQIKFFLALTILGTLAWYSCKKDQIQPESLNDENQEILDYLADQGYNLEDVEILDSFVVYQKDAGWDKAALLETIYPDGRVYFVLV